MVIISPGGVEGRRATNKFSRYSTSLRILSRIDHVKSPQDDLSFTQGSLVASSCQSLTRYGLSDLCHVSLSVNNSHASDNGVDQQNRDFEHAQFSTCPWFVVCTTCTPSLDGCRRASIRLSYRNILLQGFQKALARVLLRLIGPAQLNLFPSGSHLSCILSALSS